MQTAEELEILERLKERDEYAFAQIYNMYVKILYRYALNILKSPALAEDVVQDTFIKLWEVARFVKTDRSLQGYLLTIARNKSLNIIRRASRETWITDQISAYAFDETEDAHAYTQRKQTTLFINHAIDQLPPQRKLIYELCRNNGYSYKQAAEMLGIKDSTVNSQMVKAIRFIKSYLIKNGALIILFLIKA